MYAIIATGGKQYKVTEGDIITLEKLSGESGQDVEFNEVLLVAADKDIKVGQPYVTGAKVMGAVVSQERADKIEILKFKRRKHHMKRMGHRQNVTKVEIKSISTES